MPGLFGSRRRGSSASRPTTPTTHSAALAAATAVSAHPPPSHGALSSAAAAAALRSATTTPEPVGSIQTKRMVRRGSQSSIGSASLVGRGAQGRGGLQRRDSQASMTERTFRSPSPGPARNNSITSGTTSPAPDLPPVPAIPRNLAQSQQRSSSLDPPPQRVASPTGRNGRALSMDRARQPPPISTRRGNQLANVTEELERSDSQRNVNFSRPMASPPRSPTSPTADKNHYTHGTGAWFSEPVPVPVPERGNSSSEPKLDAAAAKMARIQAAAAQAVHTKASSSSQPSHLPGSAQSAITGTAVSASAAPAPQPMETVMVYDPNSRTFVPKLRPKPAIEPPSPTLPQQPQLKPGQYDPNTRTIVPVVAPAVVAQPPPRTASRQSNLALNTDLEPPPRNPARLSPTNSPRSSQLLQDQIGEEPEEFSGAGAGTAVGGFAKTNGTAHQRTSSLDVPSRGTASVRGRNISTSPSPQRSARFSASPVVAATKHDPPPRDISPAKPALKHSHSPASSVRTNSPLASFAGPRSPPSETSDTASQDGFSGKKKKSVRVSFDEQPHEIEASKASSPKVLARDRSPMLDDVDDEELMKPRPALPSFGSVRKNRVIAEKVTEMAPERHDVSNDHAIGGILRNANGAAKPVSEPVPPEVTSKESAGYVSDDSDDTAESSPAVEPTPLSTDIVPSVEKVEASPKSSTSPTSPIEPIIRDFAPVVEPSQPDNATLVPQINLSPPTPGTEESKNLAEDDQSTKPRSSKEIVLPGGWDGDNEAEVESAGAASATAAAIGQQVAVSSIEPVLTHSPEERSPMLAAIDEDTDSDDSAAFSDAAEDLSDLEGGFASIDAIAVSPMNAKAARNDAPSSSATSAPDGPVAPQAEKKQERAQKGNTTQANGDWSEATAYWSNLTKVQREQIERDHLSSDDEARPAPATRKIKKSALKPTTGLSPTAANAPAQKSSPAHRDAQPAQSAMLKKTMRAQPGPAPAPAKTFNDGPVRMRRSMRDGSAGMSGGMAASSLRDGPPSRQSSSAEPRGALQKKSLRPGSSGGLSSSSAGAAMNQSRLSQDTAPPRPQSRSQNQPVVSARLQKELAHDSDSESSFKKKRRGSQSTVDSQGRFAMKRSMRPGSVSGPPQREERPVSPTPPRAKGKDSFSIRSLSPTGSFFGRKKQKEIRESLRGNSVDAGSSRMTTLRSSQPPPKAARQTPALSQRQSRFKSRFVDSDDSDDDAPRRGPFRSRFVDSDDDEDDAPLAPVRGIPRRQGQADGDSTDLEDSDDDTKKASRKREKQATPLVPSSEDIDKAMDAARKKLGMEQTPAPPQTPAQNDGKQGQMLSHGSLRNPAGAETPEPKSRPEETNFSSDKKRRTFMGSILRRNRSSQQSVSRHSFQQSEAPPMPSSPLVTQSPATTTASPIPANARPQSPTSPGKLVRRSSTQPQPPRMKRGDSSFSTATAPPMMGQITTGEWPLPPVPKIPDHVEEIKGDARPATSDGTPGPPQRSASGHNVRFSDSADSKAVYSARTGKKKKFGMLRRAFRLDD
ncbi:hypothetical protein AC578_895 [Pseudocercospora eumusae]|uniref:Uncharacterized protein n=1 Tax=Pseudocercospora eumusae TaxID=321146 RepID=A0A139GTR4_9PEZI|nr:hypothetical protein AC578_895 [Pseudocercospora eumusae]